MRKLDWNTDAQTTISGVVRDGSGASLKFFTEGKYDKDYGFYAYPGTLNIYVGEELVRDMLNGEPEDMLIIGQEIWLYQARINKIPCWISLPITTTYEHLEIIAPLRLRRHLGLENGDSVEVELLHYPNPNPNISKIDGGNAAEEPEEIEVVKESLTGLFNDIKPIAGGSLERGKAYHNIPGEEGKVHRDGTEKRVRHIVDHFDPTGLVGLDIGCSVGGITVGMAEAGAKFMWGVDYDLSALTVGQRVAKNRELPIDYICGDLSKEEAWDSVWEAGPYDFALWLSNWMWIAHQAGSEEARQLLKAVSEKVPVLIFETAQDGGSMAGSDGLATSEDVRQLLIDHTDYDIVEDIGTPNAGWHARSVFVCRKNT